MHTVSEIKSHLRVGYGYKISSPSSFLLFWTETTRSDELRTRTLPFSITLVFFIT